MEVKFAGTLAAVLMFLSAISLTSAAQPEQSHNLSEIHPIDTDLDMSGFQVFNASSFELQNGLNFSDSAFYDQGNVKVLEYNSSSSEWSVVNSDLDLNRNNLVEPNEIQTGGQNIQIRDTVNGQDVVRFQEGGNVEIPNGQLNMSSNNIVDVNNIASDQNRKTLRITPGPWKSGRAIFKVWDEKNSNELIRARESGPIILNNGVNNEDILRANASGGSNVEIPNGNLDIQGGALKDTTGPLTIGDGNVEIPNGDLNVNNPPSTRGVLNVGGDLDLASANFTRNVGNSYWQNGGLSIKEGRSINLIAGQGDDRRNINLAFTGSNISEAKIGLMIDAQGDGDTSTLPSQIDVNILNGNLDVTGNNITNVDGITSSGGFEAGNGTTFARDTHDISIGDGARVTDGRIAIGENAKALASGIAIGTQAEADGGASIIAIGSSTSTNRAATVLGSTATGSFFSTALGYQASASNRAVAVGYNTDTSPYSTAVGTRAVANNDYSIALGKDAKADANGAVAIGRKALAPNNYEVTLGNISGYPQDLNVTGNTTIHGISGLRIPNGNLDVQGGTLKDSTGPLTIGDGDVEIPNGNLDMNGNNLDNVGGLNGDCPTGYVWVPGSGKFGTLPGFCVMKYEAKDDGSGNPVSQASGSPWVSIEQYTARQECRSLGDGYHLISEKEWMTIAENVMRQTSNWADGTIGSKASNGGGLYMGNVAPPASHSHLGYDGSDPDSGTGRDTTARLQLENGNYVWDISGNVWEWTDYRLIERDTAGTGNGDDTDGVTDEMVDAGGVTNRNWFEYTEVTDYGNAPHMQPMNRQWNASNGIGRIYITPGDAYDGSSYASKYHAVRRGGDWGNGAYAGALSVFLGHAPSNTDAALGFRCSLSPVS